MAAVCQQISPAHGHGTRRKAIGQKQIPHTHVQELIFTRSKGPADFRPKQSKRTDQRRKRKGAIRGTSDSKQDLPSRPEDDDSSEASPRDTPCKDVVPPAIPNSTLLEHIATSRFFHHYVSPMRTCFRLDLDFTSFVIDNAAMRSTLSEAVIALGILTLPRKSSASCTAARLRYARALKLTNEALRNETAAKSDEVLMAVILLSFFETTPDDEHSLASWTAHLDGARMLLRIRGCDLLQRGPTYRMFSMLRQQILLNCLMSMQPVPQDLIDLSTRLMETQDQEERAASQVVLFFSRLCNLFALSREATPIDRTDVLTQAIALDDDLINWTKELPPSYDYFTEPSTSGYSGYCEVYQSFFAAEVWNLYRSTRLGVNGLVIEQKSMIGLEKSTSNDVAGIASPDIPTPDYDLDIRFSVVESLRNDICAATPFMLGRNAPNESRNMADIPLCKRTPVMHHLLFILRTAGITKEMSQWATTQINELQSEKEVESGAVWNNSTLRIACD